jgi:MFS family permease
MKGPLRHVFIDVRPLRSSRQFRLLWSGQLVSFVGTQLSVVAVPIQVYKLTGSSLAVGLLGIVQVGPLLVCALFGGALADAFDRRRVLLAAQVCLAATSVGLALNAWAHRPALWLLYGLSAAAAGLAGIDSPTRAAAIPSMVKPAELPAALALNQMLMQAGLVVGPALGGIVIAKVDIAAAYWIDVATFGVSLAAVLAMRPMVPEGGGTKAGVKSIAEGLRYLKGRQALQGTFVIDINAMVFGMPRALFPELGTRVFGGGAATVGLLYAAPGAGALLGALGSGWVGRIQRQGYAVLVAVALWGAAIAGFGFSPWLWLGLALLAVAGAADVISAVFRNTILQLSVPDRLRGRLSAVHIAVVAGGPRLGDTESGAVSALIGARASVVSGGLACLAGVGVIARLMPALARWRPPALGEDSLAGDEPSPLAATRAAAADLEEPGIATQR